MNRTPKSGHESVCFWYTLNKTFTFFKYEQKNLYNKTTQRVTKESLRKKMQ